jgi:hypothetical protein
MPPSEIVRGFNCQYCGSSLGVTVEIIWCTWQEYTLHNSGTCTEPLENGNVMKSFHAQISDHDVFRSLAVLR